MNETHYETEANITIMNTKSCSYDIYFTSLMSTNTYKACPHYFKFNYQKRTNVRFNGIL